VPELNIHDLGPLHLGTFDKTLFSMVIPPVEAILKERYLKSVLILGIEVRLACEGPRSGASSSCTNDLGSPSVSRLRDANNFGPPG